MIAQGKVATTAFAEELIVDGPERDDFRLDGNRHYRFAWIAPAGGADLLECHLNTTDTLGEVLVLADNLSIGTNRAASYAVRRTTSLTRSDGTAQPGRTAPT